MFMQEGRHYLQTERVFVGAQKRLCLCWKVGTISKLREFLLEHRKDYVNAGR